MMSKKITPKYSPEVRERAVVQEHRGEYPSVWAAIESIAPKIGCVPQTLHEWVKRHEIDTGMRDSVTSEERERIKALEREVTLCAHTGYSEAELLWRSFSEITHPDDRAADYENWLRVARGEAQAYQTEKRYVRKDGAVIWVDVKMILMRDQQGHALYTLGVIADITDCKQLHAQLAEHSAQLQRERNFIDAILDTAAVVIIVTDAEERLVRFNQACNTLSGYDFAEFKGTTPWQRLVPADEVAGIRQVVAALRAGAASVQHENHWIRRDGTRRLFNWHNSALRDESGKVHT
jgi:transposase